MVGFSREKLKLGVRSAESIHFSYDNSVFSPEKQSTLTVTTGDLSRTNSQISSPVAKAVLPSVALAPVHISGSRFKTTAGPLQRVTSIPGGTCQVLRIKPYQLEVGKLKTRMRYDFAASLFRNFLCAVFLTSIVITALEEHHIPDWFIKKKVPILVFLLCGLVGVVLQVVHVTSLIRGGTPTTISRMLRFSKSRDDFLGIMQERRNAAPFMAVEVMLKSNEARSSFANKKEYNWVNLARETLKSLVYNSWDDQSVQIDNAMKNKSCWLVLAKDYTSDTVITRKSFEADIDSFREDTGFDKYLARMKLKYLLDVQRGEFFPDAEPHYVYGDSAPKFQSIQMYTVVSCLAMDAFYSILFFLLTKNAGVCRLVKCMSRSQYGKRVHQTSVSDNNNNYGNLEDESDDINVLSV